MKLDIYDLDTACLEQADLFEQAGQDWAAAVSTVETIENQLALLKAEVDEEIRKKPIAHGLPEGAKPTETWISNRVLQDERIKEIQNVLIEANTSARTLLIIKQSMDQRLKTLDMLVSLYKANYFAVNTKVYTEKEVRERESEVAREENTQHPRMQKLILKRKEEASK